MSDCGKHEYGECDEEVRFGDLVIGWDCGPGAVLMTYGGAELSGSSLQEAAALLTRLSRRPAG